ncbi:hypothetical protein OIU74_006836 [Salix koriyanagi]|uniref:Uncharacterized protein n=1 Tax=Salix koriyanagi TaxID=2511006 RepID=A0A9Q0ZC18_9ROSI|nr:hypothetical protein OIU74_006836 [Salix koriyanagi]
MQFPINIKKSINTSPSLSFHQSIHINNSPRLASFNSSIFPKLLFLLAMLISLLAITTLSATPTQDVSFPDFDHDDKANSDHPRPESQETTSSLKGTSRFLAQTRAFMTCDKNPRVCRA